VSERSFFSRNLLWESTYSRFICLGGECDGSDRWRYILSIELRKQELNIVPIIPQFVTSDKIETWNVSQFSRHKKKAPV
jgi:hypothetical protein